MPRRFDAGTAANVQRTPQGGYRVDSLPGRAGVLVYRTATGIRRELRPPEEVFAPQSLATLAGAPVTDDHPPGEITPANWSTYAKGHVADNVGREGDYITAPLVIQDSGLCQKIDDGRAVECSCGYSCDLDMTSGVWGDGNTPYDAIQRNIVYNHLALGGRGWGRAGPGASLRLDSADAVEDNGSMKVTVAGKEYDQGSAEHVKALEALVASEKARADSATVSPEAIRKAASARAVLLAGCQKIATFKGQRFDAEAAEGADDSALMIESIKQVDPGFEPPKEGSPDFLSGFLHGYFRAIVATLKPANGPAMAEDDAKNKPEKPMEQPTAPADGTTPTQGNPPPPAAGGRADAKSIFTARSGAGGTSTAGAEKDLIREAEERNRNRSANAWKGKEQGK